VAIRVIVAPREENVDLLVALGWRPNASHALFLDARGALKELRGCCGSSAFNLSACVRTGLGCKLWFFVFFGWKSDVADMKGARRTQREILPSASDGIGALVAAERNPSTTEPMLAAFWSQTDTGVAFSLRIQISRKTEGSLAADGPDI